MRSLTRLLWLAVVVLLCAAPAATSGEEAEEVIKETMVVTASRTEQNLHQAPAAITVLTSEDLEKIPADNYGDYLRNVPGLNIAQFGARDVNVVGRGASQSLADSQLVLMDNRSLYLDFFGFVMWDLVPLDPNEIKQIEVVRGPGSAVWGANAMSGVINLITKSPKEMQGTSVRLGGGDFDTFYGSVAHAGVSNKLGYKLSAAYYEQGKPYDRPTGTIPGTASPLNPGGTLYPPYMNEGTEQPKINLRFDYDSSPGTTWIFSGGYAGTDGIMQSGIGPFDIDNGTTMSFIKLDWNRRAARASVFVNILDGDATNLLTRGIDGQPVAFAFDSETFDLDLSNTNILGGDKHILTYGAKARRNKFDLSIAPQGDQRDEYGVFVQDEILFSDKVRWLIGARWDDIDPIGSVVSPRTSLLISPTPNNTIRFSYNEAFKAPSMINNFLELVIVNLAALPTGPFIFPSLAIGNPLLMEEQLVAYEIGWVGTFGRSTVTLSAYQNETTDDIDFFPATFYTAAMPPPGFPLPTFVLAIPPPLGLAGVLPASFSYRNIGKIIDNGVEFSLEYRPSTYWSTFFNASWQDTPETKGIDQVRLPSGRLVDPVNQPPEYRVNFGVNYSGNRFFGSAIVNYQDEAFWTDVLDQRFWGPTDSWTMVNLGVGVYLAGDKMTLGVKAQNAFDEDIQQHVFGDIIAQKILGQVTFRF